MKIPEFTRAYLKRSIFQSNHVFVFGGERKQRIACLNEMIEMLPDPTENEDIYVALDPQEELTLPDLPHWLIRGDSGYEAGLKSALRVDPSTIVVVEIPKEQIVQMAIGIETGHQFFASVGEPDSHAYMYSLLDAYFTLGVDYKTIRAALFNIPMIVLTLTSFGGEMVATALEVDMKENGELDFREIGAQ